MTQTLVLTSMLLLLSSGTGIAQRTLATVPSTESANNLRKIDALLARPVTIDLKHVTLKQAIDAVAASARVLVQYQSEMVNAYAAPVTLHLTNVPLRVALAQVLQGTTLQVVPDGTTQLMLVETASAHMARFNAGGIVGIVTEGKTKRPLRGAKIGLDAVDRVAETDEGGKYRLSGVSAGTHTLTVKLLGYTKATRAISVEDNQTVTVNVALDASASPLEQVVVTGTIIPTERKAIPNAMTIITAKEIEQRGITHLDQLFRGDVPGVFALNIGSNAQFGEVTMFSRGATALSAASAGTSITSDRSFTFTNPMKTYVDGVELSDSKYLSQIDPKSIERIEILTGPQASTIYGSNAINGVMQVFTKRSTNNTPQLTLNLLSGFVQNNFSSARTPQHDYSTSLDGVERHLSYNAGGSWDYLGPWTPAERTARLSGFGGMRLTLPTAMGSVTTDVTLRRASTQNRQYGANTQLNTINRTTGFWAIATVNGVTPRTSYALFGQTLGITVGYVPATWWSNEFGIGQDLSNAETRYLVQGYQSPSDTMLQLTQSSTDRRSWRYTTTLRAVLARWAQVTLTGGMDGWQKLTSSWSVQPLTLTGTLTGSTSITRQPDHNMGMFMQTQVGINDQVFLTYGLRAEWNPNYGADAQPNYAPRYGMAYTREVGPITAKLRGSYGRSTRPPASTLKSRRTYIELFGPNAALQQAYGNLVWILANPALAPEHQQGSEGGLELYWGTRASVMMTRYNQTVDGLIDKPIVDSARSQIPTTIGQYFDTAGYGYLRQTQYLNIGSIRNQGWELQGSVNTGPFATRGTYSWTKSRSLGVYPKYRIQFADVSRYPQYQPGATFQYVPEHTWMLGSTYVHTWTTVGLNVTGTGQVKTQANDFALQNLTPAIRLAKNRMNVNNNSPYISVNNGYPLIDLAVSRRISGPWDALLQVQNVANRYANDLSALYATMGRQVKAGVRGRLH